MPNEYPEFDKFLSDPSFQKDRDFLDKYFENFLSRKQKEAEDKARLENASKPKNIFDVLFGPRS